jgi:hypothetical protein
MGNILSPEEKAEYLLEHIPYRLTAVDGLCAMLHRGALHVDPYVRNAIYDAGLIHMRALFSLLGIGANQNAGDPKLKEATSNSDDDITLKKLSLQAVKPLSTMETIALFRSVYVSSQADNDIEVEIAKVFQYSSKASAHIVLQPKRTLNEYFEKVALVCIGAIMDRIYDVEKISSISFDEWTRRGDLLICEEKHRHDTLIEIIRMKSKQLRQ